MALTRVAPAGIGSTPGTGYVIGDSFLHSRGLNSIDANYTGIVTTQSLRVIGDLEVEGTTTTLDTALTEVDKLEVGANNNTVGVAITQSGTGDILNLYDGGTEVFSVTDGGKVKIGTETEGQPNADNLTIADSANCGITIRSGNTSGGAIYFSDGTSGGAEYDGYFEYFHNSRYMRFGTATQEQLRIDSSGRLLLRSGTTGSTDRVGGFHNALQVEGTSATSSSVAIIRNSNDQNAAYLNFGKSRGTSLGSNTAVSAGDSLAIISFTGSDGSGSFNSHASIRANVDGATGNGDSPGRISFWTTPDGSASSSERLTIKSDGKIGVEVASPQQKLDVVGSAHTVAVFRPDTNTVSAYGDASVVNNLVNLRMPYGSNPGSQTNNGARWGIKFQGRNDGAEYGTDAGKSASIYAVSEETNSGYNRQVGLAFYTSPFDANQQERLRITSAGKMGLGTNSPAYLAHIHNSGTGSGDHSYLHFTTGDTGATGSDGLTLGVGANQTAYINFRESGPLVLSTSGTERLRILSDGNIGIGDDNPSVPLNVKAGGASFAGQTTHVKIEDTTSLAANVGGLLAFEGVYNSNGDPACYGMIHGGKTNADNGNYAGYLRFLTRPSNALPQERLRIDSSGNVMINRTSSSKKFSVRETSTSSGVYYNAHIGGNSHLSNYAVGIGFDPEGYSARTKIGIVAEGIGAGYSRGKLHFLLDSANDSGEATLSESRMTITDTGNVGIGENNPSSSLVIKKSNNSGVGPELVLNNSSGSYGDEMSILFSSGGTPRSGLKGGITSDGQGSGWFSLSTRNPSGNYGERIRVISNGFVGINTTSPSRHLEVFDASQGSIAIKSGDSGQSSLWLSDSDINVGGIYYEHNNNALGIRVNDSERFRIKSDGKAYFTSNLGLAWSDFSRSRYSYQ